MHIGDGEDLIAQARDVVALKAQSATLEREALNKCKHVARELADRGVPVRDIGAILGVTHQRADQLVKS